MSSKTTCVTCSKGVGQFKCEGCSQAFCLKHVAEHRQSLNQQLGEVIVEYDVFQETIKQEKQPSDNVMHSIAQWETQSIEKIRQMAEEIRNEVKQIENNYQSRFIRELKQLKERIQHAQTTDDFFENDLRQWTEELEKLKTLRNETFVNNVQEDSALSLIHSLQISSVSSNREKAKLHPRLQYTQQDGVYMNPPSTFVSAIWYFYSPKYKSWFWTPYKDYEIWMPVSHLIVKSGYYKGQYPVVMNREIIKYLHENNPLPPKDIIDAAAKAEERILKL